MKREDVDAMAAKAQAALDRLPANLRGVRWTLGHASSGPSADMLAIDVPYPDDPDCGHLVVEDVTNVLTTPTAEHIAASDPLAVLALVEAFRAAETGRAVERMISGLALSGDAMLWHAANGFMVDVDGAKALYEDAMKWRAANPPNEKPEGT